MKESAITGEADIMLNPGIVEKQSGKVRRNYRAKIGLLIRMIGV